MKIKFSCLLTTFLFCFNFITYAQELGSLFIKNYSAEAYNAHPQNWAIIQDYRGIMYFGNTECIVEYDGSFWNKIYSSNNSMIRSFALAKDSVIYVGAVGDFGYLAADSLGNTKYFSLTQKLDSIDKDFNDVWETVSSNSGIFFRSNKKLFRYNYEKDEIKVWSAVEKKYFNPSFAMPNLENDFIFRISTQYQNMVNDEIKPLENSNLLNDYFIYKLLPFSDSKFICITFNQLFLFDLSIKNSEPASIFSNDLTTEFEDANLYMGTKYNDQKFIVNSRKKGIYIISKNGNILEHISVKSNLQDNFVWTSFLSRDSLLWVGLDKGFSTIEINSPFRIWDKNTGFKESVNEMIRFDGKIYLATMNGLFYFDEKTQKYEQNDAVQILGTKNELWKFVDYYDETSKKHRLLAASTAELIEIKDNKIISLKEFSYLFDLALAKTNKNIIYCLSNDKFEAVLLNNDKIIDLGEIAIKGVLSYSAQDDDGTIWVGTTFTGIYKIEIDKELKIDTSKYLKKGIFLNSKVELFDSLKGLPNLQRIRPFYINKQILFGTNSGIYIYNKEKNIIEKETFYTSKFKNPNISIDEIEIDCNGNIYFLSSSKIYKLTKTNNGDYSLDSTIFKRLDKYFKKIINAQDSNCVWIAGSDNITRYNPQIKFDTSLIFNTLIRKVTINNDSIIFNGNYFSTKLWKGYKFDLEQPKNLIPILDYKFNSIVFHYSSPYFILNEETQYSYKLEGYESEWSKWTTETKKEYTNLDEGEYVFNVKAKNIYDQQSTIAQYKFRIKAPFYRTIFAYIIYVILSILLIFLVVKIYSRRLINEKIKLENIVKERTKEILFKNIELENQKEEILAQSEELEIINVELEKLSIVASETDNAIVITDKFGNFEWINKGFTRLYGFSFEEYTSISNNLLTASTNKNLKELLNICLNNKKSVNYESFMITKSGEKIWAQSTITPILNQDNELIKLIIIDTDISKVKKAEQEILQKNEEIIAQKEALEQQNEEISAQRDELEEKNIVINTKNDMIKGSIRYAKTIQIAILPDIKVINQHFNNFLIYRPKDIVSGDFYWFQEINNSSHNNHHYIAVVDCTGHGVPGAFMSMIASRILNEIVIKNNNISPAEILTLLSQDIVNALRQKETDNKDGMDICLVKIQQYSENQQKVIFCGAKRELIYYNIENNEIIRLKGDRKTIGGVYEKVSSLNFTNSELILKQKSIIYLSTDGFVDQNNLERKRFGTTKLIDILNQNCEKQLPEQKEILEKSLNDWQFGVEQRDDITFMGIQI